MSRADTEIEKRLRERLRANLKAADAALKVATGAPTVTGSNGQPRPNPLFAVAEAADGLALKYAAELRTVIEHRERATEDELLRKLMTG